MCGYSEKWAPLGWMSSELHSNLSSWESSWKALSAAGVQLEAIHREPSGCSIMRWLLMCALHVFFPPPGLERTRSSFSALFVQSACKRNTLCKPHWGLTVMKNHLWAALAAACWSVEENSGIRHFLMVTNSLPSPAQPINKMCHIVF